MEYIDPAECPYYLITRASLSLTARLKRELVNSGAADVKPAYLGVLMCLWTGDVMDEVLAKFGSEGGCRLNELGRYAGLEPSTMTGLIDRMEKDGLVNRSNDPIDRRAQRVCLTEKGLDVRDRVFDAVNKMLGDAFAGIEPEQFETAKKVMRKILINVNKGGFTDEP